MVEGWIEITGGFDGWLFFPFFEWVCFSLVKKYS